MTIGETFKQARKKMGLNLDEVAAKTKITKNFLEAIEGDELDRLPGEVYARHFLKIYSRLVKIDEDIVITEYHQQYGVKPHSVAHQEQTRKDDVAFKRERRRNVLIVSILVGVLGISTLIFLQFKGSLDLFGTKASEAASEQAKPVNQPDTGLARELSTLPAATSTAESVVEQPEVATSVAGSEELSDASGADVSEPLTMAENSSEPLVMDENRGEGSGADHSSGLAGDDLPVTDESLALGFPYTSLDDVMVVGGVDAMLADVFIIGALEDVRVEVFIDGISKTNRLLRKGSVRAYPYGNYHTVTIYDASRVMIQEGTQMLQIPEREGSILSLKDWQQGELRSVIDNWAEQSTTQPDLQ